MAQNLWPEARFLTKDGVGGGRVLRVIFATLAENQVFCCDFLHNL